jgi:hypothetical protein
MKCHECEELIVDALYDELPAEKKPLLQAHLAECPDCIAAYREMSGTMKVMNQRVREEPDPAFWNNYWNNLAPKLQQATSEKPKVLLLNRKIPTWMMQAAAAVVLILLGVIIGKVYFTKTGGTQQIVRTAPKPDIVQTAANERAHRFLQRSELLLLGFVNAPHAETSDVAYSRKVSGELIQEGRVLESTLTSPEQRKLRRLVSDLQIILLQIANLEEEHDLPEIEMVKSGAERTGILLQINLELMRAKNSGHQKTEEPKTSGKRKL